MEYKRITLRIPTDLHEELVASALVSSKSVNAEIIERVRKTYKEGGQKQDENELREIIRDELRKLPVFKIQGQIVQEELKRANQ